MGGQLNNKRWSNQGGYLQNALDGSIKKLPPTLGGGEYVVGMPMPPGQNKMTQVPVDPNMLIATHNNMGSNFQNAMQEVGNNNPVIGSNFQNSFGAVANMGNGSSGITNTPQQAAIGGYLPPQTSGSNISPINRTPQPSALNQSRERKSYTPEEISTLRGRYR